MERKNSILIIIALIVIAVAGLLIAFNFFQKEEVETPQVEEPEIKTYEVDPKVQRAVEVRKSMKNVPGELYEVHDDYLIIGATVYKEDSPVGETWYKVERERIRISEDAEVFSVIEVGQSFFEGMKIGDIKVPSGLRPIEKLKYLINNYQNDYFIYVDVFFPKNSIGFSSTQEEEINYEKEIATYIEWSASSKGGN